MQTDLRADGWAEYNGSAFEVIDTTVNGFSLTLREVVQNAKTEHNDTFSLIFHGPSNPLIAQGIHRLKHATLGEIEIFLVPVARNIDGYLYEAVFNLLF